MLVQPALIAHLLCRPVSIADSSVGGKEIQALFLRATLCYRFEPAAFGSARPKRQEALQF
jgi:hypothetical protein